MNLALKILGVLVLLLLLVGLFAPKHHIVERSVIINAPSGIIHDQINNFEKWPAWSPWDKMDPGMKKEFGATKVGKGAFYTWNGEKLGKGKLTITSSTTDTIKTTIEFGGMGTSEGIYSLKPEAGGINLGWKLIYDTPFPFNAFSFLMNYDKDIGKDFEVGLASLKTICEKLAKEPRKYLGFDVKEVDLASITYAFKRAVVKFQDISTFLGSSYQEVGEACGKLKTNITGPASSLYWKYDEKAGNTDMGAALPIDRAIVLKSPLGTIDFKGKALSIDYYGAYEKTGNAHLAMDDYMKEKNLKNKVPIIEQYITDPMVEKDTSKWLTRVIYYVE